MFILDLLGGFVVGLLLVAGCKWIAANVSIRNQPEPYTYYKDKEGNEAVKDNTDK